MNFIVRLFIILGLTVFMFVQDEFKVVAVLSALALAAVLALIEIGRPEGVLK